MELARRRFYLRIPTWRLRRSISLRNFRNRIEAAGARLVFSFFRVLPLDAASALGGFAARSIGPHLGISKRARINLRQALPELDEAAIEGVVAGMWDNLGRVVAEYPHLRAIRIFEAGGRVEVEGVAEHVAPLIAAGRRLIFVSAHFGNWEIASQAATRYGLKVAQIYRAANNPRIDALIHGFRAAAGSELIPKGPIAARKSIEALREGRHLAVLVDQKMNDGIPVPFFGRDAMTPPAVAQLALRFDCAIIPARVERLRGANFRLTIFPPIEIPRSGDRHADILEAMARINSTLESWITARPDLWFWLHRRWPD
jgi:Kdo2-lipid IVA lauroyltransferase/acyltransferase